MSLAEERRSEKQTFELEAKRVRNKTQVRSKEIIKKDLAQTLYRRKKSK